MQVQMVAWEKSQLLFSFDYLQMSLDLFFIWRTIINCFVLSTHTQEKQTNKKITSSKFAILFDRNPIV